MTLVRDTPSSDGACVYEVLLNYLERIKLWTGEAKSERMDGRTDTRTIHAIQ
jgi:hypothetical protein